MTRQCGSCSLCCRLLDIPEFNAPPGTWCRHCKPGVGCRIHPDRPENCRTYECAWLMGKATDDWFPAKCKIICDQVMVDPDGLFMRFTVDPGYPTRWRERPFYDVIKQMAREGLRGVDGLHFKTVVSINGKWTLILPDREIPHGAGVLVRLSTGKYEFIHDRKSDRLQDTPGAQATG